MFKHEEKITKILKGIVPNEILFLEDDMVKVIKKTDFYKDAKRMQNIFLPVVIGQLTKNGIQCHFIESKTVTIKIYTQYETYVIFKPLKIVENNKSAFLVHQKIFDTWVWVCSLCGQQLAPVKVDEKAKNKNGMLAQANLQSKGAASQHLMTHGKDLVQHGRTISDTQYRYHKIKLTDEQIKELKEKKTVLIKRKGFFSNYGMLAVDKNNIPIARVIADINFTKTRSINPKYYSDKNSLIIYNINLVKMETV